MSISNNLAVVMMSLVFAIAPNATADITVRFDAPDVTVGLGDVFSMDILADIPAAEPVLGWGLDLAIADAAIASLTGAPVVAPPWFATFTPDGDGLGGMAFPFSVSGDSVLLATITMSADSLGETDLFLGATAGDLTEGFPLDPAGFAGIVFETGHITVVPVPGAALLGAIGLGVIGLFRRRHA